MGDFAVDTAVEGGAGRYRAHLSREWDVWGPNGGYVAAVALRALGAESPLPRPATFTCQYLNVAKFEAVDLAVTTLRVSKRAAALRVSMTQGDRPILEALSWFVAEGMEGLTHDVTTMPDVPGPDELKPMEELVDDYDKWYPFWQNVESRPPRWVPHNEWRGGPPEWLTWTRFRPTATFADPIVDASRSLLWLDTMLWPAASAPHTAPQTHIAPNLDVSVQFHAAAPDCEWLLCDGTSPVATGGLMGCTGRIWTPDGRLLASGGGQLFCRPNPFLEEQQRAVAERERAQARDNA